ncbi:MAG: calcium/sodium antiporter [Parcubacteria group bacterium]|nr:calcium/sodium antiporter [Parcubacteria group bacterium]
MAFTIFLFFIGFYILIKGANFLVNGASSIAKFFSVPSFVIGLVIVGIGTSIPEFAITLVDHITGAGNIGLGTIIGSNTFNILFILGITALAFTLPFKQEWVKRDLRWNMTAIATAAFFAFFLGKGEISRFEGGALIGLFLWWLFVIIKKTNHAAEDEKPARIVAFPLALGLILAGIAGTVLGGKWVIDGAMVMAQAFGVGESLIGLTIIGIGTSLPELAVTFTAAYRGRPGIAIGNIIGSNIFDFLMILGVAAIIRPVFISPGFSIDIAMTFLASILLYSFMFIGKLYVLKRWQGLTLFFLYAIYILYLYITAA